MLGSSRCRDRDDRNLYGDGVLALGLSQAKNIAIIVVVVLVLIAIVTAKVVTNVTKKVIALLIMAALALGVFTQRQQLQSCADKARARLDSAAVVGGTDSTLTCHFFGSDVHISAP